MDSMTLAVMTVLVCVVAILYSSVGHGGASGYLAVLSFFSVPISEMASTALALNVIVSAIALYSFYRARYFDVRLAWPFLLLSVPAAFLGGLIHVTDRTYLVLLALVLVVAAYRLSRNGAREFGEGGLRPPRLTVALPVGAGIGLLSGTVGVGGGIFLSPILIFMKWADPKKTAATSAFFILANSIAGIGGRLAHDDFRSGPLLPLMISAVVGGILGSYVGANKFTGIVLRRILAVVLLFASGKLLISIL